MSQLDYVENPLMNHVCRGLPCLPLEICKTRFQVVIKLLREEGRMGLGAGGTHE